MRVLFLHVKWLITITVGEFCNIWGTQSSKNIWNYSQTESAWFVMTLHKWTMLCQNSKFCLQKIWQLSPTLFTSLIWPLMILSHFQACNCIYEGVASRMSLKFSKNHWPFYLQFLNVSLKVLTAVANKNIAHIAWSWKGTTLRTIKAKKKGTFIRGSYQVMSNFVLHANWEQQMEESAVVDGTSCCVVL